MSDHIGVSGVNTSATASTEDTGTSYPLVPHPDTTELDTTTVQVIVKDETDLKNQQRQIINLSVSYTIYDLHYLIGQKVKYKMGTFTLVWDKQDSTVKENEIELDEDCKVSLYDFGFKSKRETVCIRDKNDRQPQAVTSDDEEQKNVELRNVTWNTTFNTTANSYNGPRPVNYTSNSSWYPSYHMQQSETGFVGLVNQAMTCYLNSLLQTLYMSPEFRNAIYKWRFCKAEKEKERCIPYQLQRLFIQLQTSDKRAVETTDVTRSFGWDTNEAWQQHDVQELCRVMFDALEINFKKTEQSSLINHLYQGEMKDYVKCLECNQESARHDTFLDIPLVIKPFGSTTAFVSVEEALEAFIEPETLEGDNQYQCENCSKKCDAHKGLKFTKFPYLLTLQLKRFDFDYTTMHRIKLNDRMTFPFYLDLNEYIEKEGKPDPAKRQKSTDSFIDSDRPSSKQSTSSETGSSSANTLEPGMDGYQALPEDHDTEEIANQLMSNLNIPSEDSALVPLIVDGDINTDDKILNSPSTPPIHTMDVSDNGLSSKSEDEPTTPNGPPALPSQGGYVSPVENNIEDFSPASKRRGGDGGTYQHHSGYSQINSESEDGDNQAATEEDKMEECNLEELLKKGPFVYELFSIMIHSGSAIGGHYYAYIKSLRDKKWYQFNDQSVTTMSYTDIERAYGGVENSRGYYSTLFSSSANAYMLMYRQIDSERNTEFIDKNGFPDHIHDVIKEFNAAEIEEKLRIERERSLCKLKLFCNHPKNSVKITELHFEVHKDKTFREAEDQAYEQLELKDYAPRDCCRLVKYDEVYETLDMSYEEHQNTPFAHLMGGVRHSYIHDLLMEIKKKEQKFQIYKPGGIMVKVFHVDLDAKCVREPQVLRAHQTMTVGEFKRLIEEEMDIPAKNMRILLERYYYELRMLEYDHYLLKQEGFYRINKVFVEGGKFDDHLNPIENSQMYRVVDSHINAVSLIISLPSAEDVEKEKADMMAIEAGEDPFDGTAVTVEPSPDNTELKTGTSNSDKEVTTTESDKETTTTTTTEVNKETTTTTPDADLDLARNKPKPRIIKLKIDKRLTISDLKKRLEPEVGVSTDYFKIIRVYSNLQEFEYTRLGDTLSSFVDDVKIVVRLGRALKPGEYRAKVYFLNVKATEEITKFLMDFIVSKELSVKDAKLEILSCINRKKTEYIPEGLTYENLRLRKKTWKNPGSIYFDDQYFDKDINVFNGSEMFVEKLDGVEPMSKQTDLQIYLRRWRPSSYSLEAFEEVTINSNSVDALKHVIAQKSSLPFASVEFAKGQGSFPCDISLLEIQEELDWNPSAMYINTWPLYMHDDGSVIYYRDKTEALLVLSDQKRQELQKRETARLQKLTNTSHMTWVKPKERALIIHVKDTSTTDEPEGEVHIEQKV
eukprot:TRINITY_DN52_c0_g1_i6.p1 TRINITY_DN52_c0_g1~~TRINITY_DN52_c0_g1_i6.p1  ORF type:complete len:1401 (+),score=392.26 TRINITY_DN52_c0_g1_i6:46-4248(+)